MSTLREPWTGQEEGGLFVRRTPGTGAEPAVFVHGLGGSSTNWTDLMGELSPCVDGAAVDLPGFGRSVPAPSYTVGAHARAVVAFLEGQRRGPVHLFGNSLGGAVSIRVAARRPDLVRTLTLISPALPDLRPRRGLDPRLPLLVIPGVSSVVRKRMRAQSPEQRARAVLNLCWGDPTEISPERLAEAAAEVARRDGQAHSGVALAASASALIRSYLVRGRASAWELAGRVTAPTLLVWGDRDRLVDVRLAPRAQAALRGSRLLVLPGVGHVAQMERPQQVATAFLALREDADALGRVR